MKKSADPLRSESEALELAVHLLKAQEAISDSLRLHRETEASRRALTTIRANKSRLDQYLKMRHGEDSRDVE